MTQREKDFTEFYQSASVNRFGKMHAMIQQDLMAKGDLMKSFATTGKFTTTASKVAQVDSKLETVHSPV